MVSISTIRRDVKQEAKAAKNNIIRNLCNRLNKIKEEENGVIKHGLIYTIIQTTVEGAPQFKITSHNICYMQGKMAKERERHLLKTKCDKQNEPKLLPSLSSLCKLGGKPEGATLSKTNNKLDSFVAARNEIATLFSEALQSAKKNLK